MLPHNFLVLTIPLPPPQNPVRKVSESQYSYLFYTTCMYGKYYFQYTFDRHVKINIQIAYILKELNEEDYTIGIMPSYYDDPYSNIYLLVFC